MKSQLQKVFKEAELIIRKPDPEKIRWINFAITYLCNSRCKMCNIWKIYKNNPEARDKELRIDEIKDMFTSSQYLKGLQGIDLTGGEPFLRKDFVELCGFFIEKYPNATIAIPTNSLKPELIVRKLKEINEMYKSKNIYISISVDGIGKTHDKIRGITGAYHCVLELIEVIKIQMPLIKIGIDYTIMPDNYRDLLSAYELSKNLDISFSTQFAQISQTYYGNIEKQFEWDNINLGEVKKMIDVIIKERRKNKKILSRLHDTDTYYLANMVRYEKCHSRMCKCYSGTYSFFMDPYGNIFPCIMLNEKVGNIREMDFDELWLSKKARDVRKFIKDKKCACWTPCETYPSLIRDPKVMLFNLSRIWVR